MSGFIQYLRDTQGELKHVAWPTRLQTIVYTALVILLSIFIALYLGLFDYIFTNGLRNVLDSLPGKAPAQQTTTVPISESSLPSPIIAPALENQ